MVVVSRCTRHYGPGQIFIALISPKSVNVGREQHHGSQSALPQSAFGTEPKVKAQAQVVVGIGHWRRGQCNLGAHVVVDFRPAMSLRMIG